MKQVWVKDAACAVTASTTLGALLPTVVTAIPEPRSMRELPSTSTTTPPPAAAAKTAIVVLTPRATAPPWRLASSRERGPGISVTRRRSCASAGPPARAVVTRDMCGSKT